MRQDNRRLLRTREGGEAWLNGYPEDHAYLIEGPLELCQTTFQPRRFVAVRQTAGTMIVVSWMGKPQCTCAAV